MTDPTTGCYAAGQVWTYDTLPRDKDSLLKIQEIEMGFEPALLVYHISVIGVAVPGQAQRTDLMHMPVSKETLDLSVREIVQTNRKFPDHREGRDYWKECSGGVFSEPLRQIIKDGHETGYGRSSD